MEECIFCKIVKGEIPSKKVWENENHIAILDVFPNTKGMTLVIPKKHFDSDATDMADESYTSLMLAAKVVSKLLKKKLGVKRVALVMEGMGVNHVHIKLYPLYGIEKKFEEMWPKDKVYFDNYPGYISTQLGPKMAEEELEKIARKIRG